MLELNINCFECNANTMIPAFPCFQGDSNETKRYGARVNDTLYFRCTCETQPPPPTVILDTPTFVHCSRSRSPINYSCGPTDYAVSSSAAPSTIVNREPERRDPFSPRRFLLSCTLCVRSGPLSSARRAFRGTHPCRMALLRALESRWIDPHFRLVGSRPVYA